MPISFPISLSTTVASAASKKSRILKQVREGKMSVALAELNRKHDPLLNAKLTNEEILAASRGERTSNFKNAVTIEITQEEFEELEREEAAIKAARAADALATIKEIEDHHESIQPFATVEEMNEVLTELIEDTDFNHIPEVVETKVSRRRK